VPAIAKYLAANYTLPANFKNILSTQLKNLVKVWKARQGQGILQARQGAEEEGSQEEGAQEEVRQNEEEEDKTATEVGAPVGLGREWPGSHLRPGEPREPCDGGGDGVGDGDGDGDGDGGADEEKEGALRSQCNVHTHRM
jgi:hypothetical protein